MKLLVTGSRVWLDTWLIEQHLAKFPKGTVLVHGDAKGADRIAGRVGQRLGFDVRPYPADWDKHPKTAGPIRNREMFDKEAPFDAVLAFHDDPGLGKGTRDMVWVVHERAPATPIKHVSHLFQDGEFLFGVDSWPV